MEGNLHILTLTPFYPNDRDEGKGCFISEPLTWLRKAGLHNTVFAVKPFYRGAFRNAAGSIPAEWLRYIAPPGRFGLFTAGAFVFARIVGRVRELHRKDRIDLIHAHGPLPCGHVAMLLNAELKIPFVVSVHGLDVFSSEQVNGPSGRWCRRISQRAYAASQRVICISEHVREKVLEGMGRNCRTSVVYNGVDPEMFSPAGESSADRSIERSPDRTVILSIGNLIPIKGHELLVRALGTLAVEFPALTLEIIGDGPERLRLESLARQLQVHDRVHFLGRKPRNEVARIVRECTVFALPSRYEGLGCVYLEAMSAAKPVIGCREQGIAEIIRHGSNGFLVGPGNEKELILALGMLLRDANLRRKLGSSARETVLDRLTLEQQAEILARIYHEAVA